MSAELDAARADLGRDDTATWRSAQELSRAVAAEGRGTAMANMMVGDRIGEYLSNMTQTVTLLNGNASAAEAGRMIRRDQGFTSAITDNAHVGDEFGAYRAAELKLLEDSTRVARLEAVESRIAGSPDLQRAEASRRVEIGQPDVLTQNRVDKDLLTKQPDTVTQPDVQKPEEPGEKERNPRGSRRHGLAGKLLGLDS